MRADDAALQAVADRLAGQDLDVARERVVGLVAVHVHQETAVGGDPTETLDGGRPVRHRPLEVRNATDDVDAEVERRREPRLADRGAQEAVLRERDELQIDLSLDEPADLEQRLHRPQRWIADVHVTADREGAARHGPAAQLERARADLVVGERRLELAPQLDPLEEGTRAVHAGAPVGEGRVHVKVRVHEWWRREAAASVDGPPRVCHGLMC